MPIKAGWWDAFLVLRDFSQINKHCIQLFTTIPLASLLQCRYLRSSCLELFCKKGVFKNFAKFTGASSGTGVFCEFSDILKNNLFWRTPPVAVTPGLEIPLLFHWPLWNLEFPHSVYLFNTLGNSMPSTTHPPVWIFLEWNSQIN